MSKGTITVSSEIRATLREQLDELLVRCPVRLCANDVAGNRQANYGFIVEDLTSREREKLGALLTRLSGMSGNFVTNEDSKMELRFTHNNVGDFMYFGLEILPHPTKGKKKLQGALPEEPSLAKAWNNPGQPMLFTRHTEAVASPKL